MPACANDSKHETDFAKETGAVAFCSSVLARGVDGVSVTGAHLVQATPALPTHCLVSGVVERTINFNVALPTNWNGKLLFVGGGGFDGVVPDVTASLSPGALAAGYAIVGDDSGHRGATDAPVLDGSWALDDPTAVANYANLSTHSVLPQATAIVEACYGRTIEQRYFEGCSNGGREALIEAQRFPGDFDGIIARAPALDFTGFAAAFQRNAQLVDAFGATLTQAKFTTLAKAELAACDADDGAADGIIGRPQTCAFDITTLRCTSATDTRDAGDASCLTEIEIATLNAIRAKTPLPHTQVDGIIESPPWLLGHEDDPAWLGWMIGSAAPPMRSAQFTFQDQFIKYFLTKNPAENTLTTSLDAYASALTDLSRQLDATNPQLSEFSERGGKLILWHGLSDPALSPLGTTEYYEQATMSAGGREKADEFLRLFTAAGVYHCGGGPGADTVDLVSALDSWVTAGAPPENLIAMRQASTTNPTAITRPLCPYPTYPRYTGAGDVNVAASWQCARE